MFIYRSIYNNYSSRHIAIGSIMHSVSNLRQIFQKYKSDNSHLLAKYSKLDFHYCLNTEPHSFVRIPYLYWHNNRHRNGSKCYTYRYLCLSCNHRLSVGLCLLGLCVCRVKRETYQKDPVRVIGLFEDNKPIHNPPQTHAPLNHRRYTGYAQCHKP